MIYKTGQHIQTLDLGYYRCQVKAEASAFVGANIVAGVDIECEVDPCALQFRGVKRVKNAENLQTDNVSEENVKDLKASESKNDPQLDVKNATASYARTNTQTSGSEVTTTNNQTGKHSQYSSETVTTNKKESSQTTEVGLNDKGGLYNSKKSSVNKTKSKQHSSERTGEVKGLKALKDEAKANVSMFAGARAGGKFITTFEWKNIERQGEKTEWGGLAAVGAEADGNLGASLEGELQVGFEKGKFIIKVKAGATLGIGATVGVEYHVYPGNLYDFICFIYTQLRDADFDYLGFVQAEAFEAISTILCFASAAKESLSELKDNIGELAQEARDFFKDPEKEKIADQICNNLKKENIPEAIKYCTPPARGKLINAILEGAAVRGSDAYSLLGKNEDYEAAIVTILKYVQNQRDFYHTLYHSLPEEAYGQVERDVLMVLARNWVEGFLDGADRDNFKALQKSLPVEAPKSSTGPVQTNGLIFITYTNKAA